MNLYFHFKIKLTQGVLNLSKLFGVRVVIYGTHSSDWMEALGPKAPVWKLLPSVREVVIDERADGSFHCVPPRFSRTVVIPLMEDHIEKCPRRYPTFISSARATQTLRNKAVFAAYARDQDLAEYCPQLYETIDSATFPCVIKRVDLNASIGIALVNSPEHFYQLLSRAPWKGKKYILQEFIPGGRERSTYGMFENGRLLWHRSYEFTFPENSIRLNGNNRERVQASSSQLALFQRFLAPLNYTGPCNVDYKLRADGTVAVMEVNPRLGGSLMRGQNILDLKEALSLIIERAD